PLGTNFFSSSALGNSILFLQLSQLEIKGEHEQANDSNADSQAALAIPEFCPRMLHEFIRFADRFLAGRGNLLETVTREGMNVGARFFERVTKLGQLVDDRLDVQP